jgi:hypothetical protein
MNIIVMAEIKKYAWTQRDAGLVRLLRGSRSLIDSGQIETIREVQVNI